LFNVFEEADIVSQRGVLQLLLLQRIKLPEILAWTSLENKIICMVVSAASRRIDRLTLTTIAIVIIAFRWRHNRFFLCKIRNENMKRADFSPAPPDD
jgi:hypothetical protein